MFLTFNRNLYNDSSMQSLNYGKKILLTAIFIFIAVRAAFASTLIQRSIGDANRVNPIFATDSASADIAGLIFNGLLKYNNNLRLTGDIAKRFVVSPDGKTITFFLKRVKWTDGTPLTTKDLIFTYKALTNPNVATPYSTDFLLIDKITAIGPYELKVHYKTIFSPALSSWTMGILPYHLLYHHKLSTDPFNRHPVGTGPYKLAQWKTGQFIKLNRNKNYFHGKPHINHILYRILPDSTTAFLELKAGKIDVMGLSPIQLKRQITENIKKKYNIFINVSSGYTYLGLNLRKPLFSDRRVRIALDYAINKQQIINTILYGEGTIEKGIYPPTSWAYDKSIKVRKYDPAKALALLESAGFKYAGGVLRKHGKPVSFTVVTNQGNDERKYTALLIQADLRKIGIKMKLRILEWQAFLNLINSQRFDAVILGWQISPDPDQFSIWDSSQDKKGGFNFVGYHNKVVDKLLIEGRRTVNHEKRKIIYKKIDRLIFNDAPYLFLYSPYSITAVQKRFKGIKKTKAGIFYNLIDWYVPKKLEIYP